jgi:hypothetical protein
MIGLREDQQMKASLVDYLNYIAGQCGRGGATIRLAPDSDLSDKQVSTDTPPSGASPLPHLIVVDFRPVAGSAASKAAG